MQFTRQEEAAARARGFQSAEQLYYWSLRQRERQDPRAAMGGVSPRNFLSQSFDDIMKQGMAWHPKVTLEYVANKMRGVRQ